MESMFIVSGILLMLLVPLYVACPFLFYYSKKVRNTFLFANRLNFPHPRFHPLKDPSYFGIKNGENSTISLDDGVINLWSIKSEVSNSRKEMILYCHGNSCNRAMTHRVGLYQEMLAQGFDVVTFDYRGYGDSKLRNAAIPNEETVVFDTNVILEWAEEHNPDHKILIWGHSLGTGISIKLLSTLKECSRRIHGLILESPFLSSGEAGRHIPIAKIFDLLPFTRGVIGDALEGMFPSNELIAKVEVPIFILHAHDDKILPVHQGIALQKASHDQGKMDVTLKLVKEGGHKFLYKNKEAMAATWEFISSI